MGYRWTLKERVIVVNDSDRRIVFLKDITNIAEDLSVFVFILLCCPSTTIVIND
jgi:hypothetical protein